MYIQITTRCNMECAHCCYSCTEKGVDMPRSIFIEACKLAEERGEIISIGGGEPTIHPLFWDYRGIALGHIGDYADMVPWLATNGKVTETALRLANLASIGVLSVELSLDYYHEAIDQRVIDAFTVKDRYNRDNHDYRGIRDITHSGRDEPIPTGRAAEWVYHDEEGDIECICNDLFIAPNGFIYACGCQQVQYGTVWYPTLPEEWPEEWHALNSEKTVQVTA